MATILQGHLVDQASNDGGPEFAQVFVIVWIGAMIVTLNSKLLGGNMWAMSGDWSRSSELTVCSFPFRSFFQSVCVLGYCLLPVAGALIVCKILLISEQTKFVFFLRLVATLIGFLWAVYGERTESRTSPLRLLNKQMCSFFSAAYMFLGDSQPANRKPLAVYPICLFYFILSWLVISHSTG